MSGSRDTVLRNGGYVIGIRHYKIVEKAREAEVLKGAMDYRKKTMNQASEARPVQPRVRRVSGEVCGGCSSTLGGEQGWE